MLVVLKFFGLFRAVCSLSLASLVSLGGLLPVLNSSSLFEAVRFFLCPVLAVCSMFSFLLSNSLVFFERVSPCFEIL